MCVFRTQVREGDVLSEHNETLAEIVWWYFENRCCDDRGGQVQFGCDAGVPFIMAGGTDKNPVVWRRKRYER